MQGAISVGINLLLRRLILVVSLPCRLKSAQSFDMKTIDLNKRMKALKMVKSPITGLPVVPSRPGQKKVTSAQVRKIIENMP